MKFLSVIERSIYLQKHFPGKKVFLLGNELLKAEFEQEGIMLEDEHPDVVVVGFDTTLDYAKMCKVCDFVRAGLPYLSTHPDYNCPTETGFIPMPLSMLPHSVILIGLSESRMGIS